MTTSYSMCAQSRGLPRGPPESHPLTAHSRWMRGVCLRWDVSWTCRGRVVDVSWTCRGRVPGRLEWLVVEAPLEEDLVDVRRLLLVGVEQHGACSRQQA